MPADIDTLLSLAREVGAMVTEWGESSDGHFVEFASERELAAYTERIRQDEREKCAKVAEDMPEPDGVLSKPGLISYILAMDDIPAAIRSSGTSHG